MKTALFVLLLFGICASCDTGKMSEVPFNQFVGEWKLTGRSMFEGIEIKVTEEDGKFQGVITQLNENKYVLMFMEVGDKFLTKIERSSNFQFVISEKKIASALFSAYGESTSSSFDVQFNSKNEILLGADGASGKYLRVKS
ncbi:MAG: hypothetical protein ACI865_000744 [Flavobacteriaceae bacterium]|jgi:hypothetical protein